MNMYIMFEVLTTGYIAEILHILYLISVFFAVYVIIIKNPIKSVLFLIGLFFTVAIYLIMLGIKFIGLSYLLVYVGAVSILFIFILMLINVRVSELSNETNNSIPLGVIVTTFFSYCMYKIFPVNLLGIKEYQVNMIISHVTTNSWDNKLVEIDHIWGIGNVLYTNYSIWLILTSIILLLAMVGAIVITIKQ